MAPLVELIILAVGLWLPPQEWHAVHVRTVDGFRDARRCAVDADNRALVTDGALHQVYLIEPGSDKMKSVGGFGWSLGTFDTPAGVCSDGLSIYVADYGNHRIQRLDRLLRPLASYATRDTSYSAARFGFPLDAAISPAGELFILDGENQQVVKFNTQTKFERSFGGAGYGPFSLTTPLALAATDAAVMVAEAGRIVEFDLFGNPVRIVADTSMGSILSVSTTGEFVTVTARRGIYRMHPEGKIGPVLSVESLVADRRIGAIRDAVQRGRNLYVLSAAALFVFELEED